MKANSPEVSESFKSLLPLLDKRLFDSQEISTLGSVLANNGNKNIDKIIEIMERISTLKRNKVRKENLGVVYKLMAEREWDTVIFFSSIG